ncbi:MBOAT family O-acyltransferase [Paenibacillus polygoni]|uniref:MBOAT family O-acyltransferase n=1 Tax=Paenibacillus polygoni TaxID=3050112 RepID=A0ABY8X6Y9_9BACL|nr:MBOAT family O-acyltransferase [Paenibacillus polygoni]WIV21300.1 MBOAT family O-acyltransferase [Paenibacillus polygoni]
MVFSSVAFLFYFLPIALLVYYAAPQRWKNAALLLISLFFYAWGEPVYILLLLFSSVIDYMNGLLMDRYEQREKIRRFILVFSLIVNIGVLSFFKYADFLILSANDLLGTHFAVLDLPLPIGISFYTFQTMSYMIDVYRRNVPAQRSFINFAAFVSMFPQLVAGPIVRYEDIDKQLARRHVSMELFASGVRRFIIGLAKKVLLANNIGMLWDTTLSGSSELTIAGAWIGIIAFAFQIYFDFSGYSDMAIGLGRMLGFEFPENFRYPYISENASEFWRRWHITLGSWFRDYVYFPLGGSRVRKWRLLVNLFIVWFLTGLWHGANWNFVLWGLYFGFLIAIEKLWLGKWLERIWRPFRHLYFIAVILIGWTLFAIEDLTQLPHYLQVMLGFTQAEWISRTNLYYLQSYGALLIVLTFASTPIAARLTSKLNNRMNPTVMAILEVIVLTILLLASTAYIIDDSYNPFLYFRF